MWVMYLKKEEADRMLCMYLCVWNGCLYVSLKRRCVCACSGHMCVYMCACVYNLYVYTFTHTQWANLWHWNVLSLFNAGGAKETMVICLLVSCHLLTNIFLCNMLTTNCMRSVKLTKRKIKFISSATRFSKNTTYASNICGHSIC